MTALVLPPDERTIRDGWLAGAVSTVRSSLLLTGSPTAVCAARGERVYMSGHQLGGRVAHLPANLRWNDFQKYNSRTRSLPRLLPSLALPAATGPSLQCLSISVAPSSLCPVRVCTVAAAPTCSPL